MEPALTKPASLAISQSKKDWTLRFSVTYKKLNTVKICDFYPLPRPDEYKDYLEEAQILASLDANIGYWQIEVDDSHKEKTALTSHHGLEQFTRMPFGQSSASVLFQHVKCIIFSSVKL